MSPRSSGSMASLPREARADRCRRAWSRRRSRQRWKQPSRPPCGTSVCFDKLMPAASAGTTKKDRSRHCARSGPTGKPSPLAGLSRQTRRHRPMARAALFSTKTIYIRIVPKLLTNTWFRAIIISNQSECTLFDYREVPNHEAVRIRPGEHPAAKFEAAD